MAGGKETPRQKMIGMMYLVLTAMLALNVDSAVLERFVFLDNVLAKQVKENDSKNDNVIARISGVVDEKGQREDDVKVLDKAKIVRAETRKMIQYGNGLREEMAQRTGGWDGEMLVGAKDMDEVANMMIREKKGKELQVKMNEYADFLTAQTGRPFEKFALDGKDDPYFKTLRNQREKDFSALYFESIPTAAGMASISQLNNQVLNMEALALDELARQVGAKDVAFDKIVPMVLPESKVVAAGAKYKAKMFISASASGLQPSMKLDGNSLKVDEEGFGDVDFTASAGTYDKDGLSRKTFTAEIQINDEVYTQEIEYFVARPVIQIQSASVQALYLNCGNKLNVQVPALGQSYNPSFNVKGGTSIGGSQRGQVTIIPNSPNVELAVYSNSMLIGTEKFRVNRIPSPDIQLKAGGQPVDEKRGVTQNQLSSMRTLILDAIPDQSFKEALPDDARYRVTSWEITLARGTRPLQTIPVNSPEANISAFVSQARPGDRIVIEVKEVQRMNFRNEREPITIPQGMRVKQIPIN